MCHGEKDRGARGCPKHELGNRMERKKQANDRRNEKTNPVDRSQAATGGAGPRRCGSIGKDQHETEERSSLHATSRCTLKMSRAVPEESEREKSAAAGPGTFQIYLLTDGECGELVWR